MRKNRIILVAVIFISTFLLAGCTYYTEMSVKVDVAMDNCYVDMMIKIDEDDPLYCEMNENCELPAGEKSGIAKYNEDGYRSFFVHVDKAVLYRVCIDENGFREGGADYNNTPVSTEMSFCLPSNYYTVQRESNENYGTTGAYEEFCKTYKTAKFAFVDEDGDVVAVSEEFPLHKYELWYLNDVSHYNIETGEVTARYKQCNKLLEFSLFTLILFLGGTLLALIMLIIQFVEKGNLSLLSLILSSISMLSFVVYHGTKISQLIMYNKSRAQYNEFEILMSLIILGNFVLSLYYFIKARAAKRAMGTEKE